MEPGIDIEEQFESPFLIAMKGHSSSNKSNIAYELAHFLKFPLIDGDIIPTLQDLVEPEQCDGLLPSEILSRNSSTQLSLKLSVIINSQLSRRALFDGLAEHLWNLKAAIKMIIMLITLISETSQISTLTPQSHFARRTSSLVRLKTQS
jgi:hypothetical protein